MSAAVVLRRHLIDPTERSISMTYSAECIQCGWEGAQRWLADAEDLAATECAEHNTDKHAP